MLMSSHFHCSDHPYRPGGHMCCTPPRRGMEMGQLAVASAPTRRQTWPKHGRSFRRLTRCLQSEQSQVVGALWIFHWDDLCPGRHRRILLRLFRCEVESVGRNPGLLFCQKLAISSIVCHFHRPPLVSAAPRARLLQGWSPWMCSYL